MEIWISGVAPASAMCSKSEVPVMKSIRRLILVGAAVAITVAPALVRPTEVRADACDTAAGYGGHSKWWNLLCYWSVIIDERI